MGLYVLLAGRASPIGYAEGIPVDGGRLVFVADLLGYDGP